MKVLMYRYTPDEDGEYPGGIDYYEGGYKEDLVGKVLDVKYHVINENCFCSEDGATLKKCDCVVLPEGNFRVLNHNEEMIEGDLYIDKDKKLLGIVHAMAGQAVNRYPSIAYVVRKVEAEVKPKVKSKFIVPLDLIKELA